MAATLEDLQNFGLFARQILASGATDLTLEDCVRIWRQHCERQATIEDIRQGEAD